VGKFSDYTALLKDSHIRNRVLDPRSIEEADGELLDALIAATERVSEAMDGVHDALDRWIDIPDDLLPSTSETCEAFKAAIRLVRKGSGGGHA